MIYAPYIPFLPEASSQEKHPPAKPLSPMDAAAFLDMAPGTMVEGLWVHQRNMYGRTVSLSVNGWFDQNPTQPLYQVVLDYFTEEYVQKLAKVHRCYDLNKESLSDVKAALLVPSLNPTLPKNVPLEMRNQGTTTLLPGEPLGVYIGRFFAVKRYGKSNLEPSPYLNILANFLLVDKGPVWFALKERYATPPGLLEDTNRIKDKVILEVY